MNVLLSIKPKYVKAIAEGRKKYEFRKIIFKKKNIKKIFIYSSSPEKKVIGTFKIDDIIQDNPQNLWENFKEFSGVTKSEFFTYFNGRDNGFAIKIEDFRKFKNPKDLDEIFPGYVPPQSFCYIKDQKVLKDFI